VGIALSMRKIALFWLPLALFMTASLMAMDSPNDPIRLVFMGKTGMGKSTLVNAFYNFASNIKHDTHPKLFPIKTTFQNCNVDLYKTRDVEDLAHNQLCAVTQAPSEYVINNENYSLSLIDCPGVADPRGVFKDEDITKDIALFLHKAGYLHAICLVFCGSINRKTIEELYAIEQIKTLLPKDLHHRIFILLTHTNKVSQNAEELIRSMKLPTDNCFAFDHFALSKDGYTAAQTDDDINIELKTTWTKSCESFQRVVEKARMLRACSCSPFGLIYEAKELIEAYTKAMIRQNEDIGLLAIRLEEARTNLRSATNDYQLALNNKNMAEQVLRDARNELAMANQARCTVSICYQAQEIWFHEYFVRCPVRTRQISADDSLRDRSDEFTKKERELYYKESEKYRLERSIDQFTITDNLTKAMKDSILFNLVETYNQLGCISMSSINLHASEYYNQCIRNEHDATKLKSLISAQKAAAELTDYYKKAH